jgi:Ca2+-binding RTX toxin-like protein
VGLTLRFCNQKEFVMVQSFLSRALEIVGAKQLGRNQKARPRRLQPGVDSLERREVLTGGGSVVQSGLLVTITPDASATSNTAIVSNKTVNGAPRIDVQLNGVDNYFAPGSIIAVNYMGSGASGTQLFENDTNLVSYGVGGSGHNTFVGGSNLDAFVGGSGTNTFDAGTGVDAMVGGTGTNVFNESATGRGFIYTDSGNDVVNTPTGAAGRYFVA